MIAFFYYIVLAFCVVLVSKTFIKIIEPNQILYIYTDKVLNRLNEKGYGGLSKMLGGCDLCFTFHLSWMLGYFALFPLFCINNLTFGYFFLDVLIWLVFPSLTITINALLRNVNL